MKFTRAAWAACTIVMVLALPAAAHVTVQPQEAPAAAFFRFTVRVPTEREDASTVKVKVEFPENLVFTSFQPKPGWKRTVQMKKLAEPIEVFGTKIDEVVGSVTWSGGSIAPHEFDEFGFSARVPEEEGPLTFSAIQTYDSGEVVKWTGAPDSEQPAAVVSVVDMGGEEAPGQLELLAELDSKMTALRGEIADDGDDEETDTPMLLSGAALVVALGALVAALRRRQ